MAPPVEKITIAGFRGILQPLELDFTKGSGPRSMVVYGKNGTGKSSLTDAWEWFHKGNIDHLRREGARAGSFPHRDAGADDTYVEVAFEEDGMEEVRLTFDPSRKTMPEADGNLDAFREQVPHPFYIRFEDLKEFVYQTKAEKYDKLAHLMGFEPQVKFQKGLRRTLANLKDELEKRTEVADQRRTDLLQLLDLSEAREAPFLDLLNERLERNEVDPAQSLDDLREACDTLEKRVENDSRAQRMSELGAVSKMLREAAQDEEPAAPLLRYANQVDEFKDEERSTVDTLLAQLYEAGNEVLQERFSDDEEADRCPLCDQPYDGDLAGHIQGELKALRHLRDTRKDLGQARVEAQETMRGLRELPRALRSGEDVEFEVEDASLASLREQVAQIDSDAEEVLSELNVAPEKLTDEHLADLRQWAEAIQESIGAFKQDRSSLLVAAQESRKTLEEDTGRKQLVDDYNTVRDALEQWHKLQDARTQRDRLQDTYDQFEQVVEDYVRKNVEDVEQRFSEISEDVQRYFEILEEDTKGLARPALRLIPEKDRAVMLEVEFHGEATSPAYKYLSESQLNSFGLAVFLASAKRFNPEFPFLVLDDVINSFDAYKRLKLIDLLKDEMQDHQVLALTHDRVWIKQIADQFPRWKRRRFRSWEPNYGPIDGDSAVGLEFVEKLLEEDLPESAGRELGAFLERQLQLLCELFQATIKYRRDNEHNLNPLFVRFRVRAKGKLNTDHELTQAVLALEETSSFRNFCAHWKNPETPFTVSEISTVLEKWRAVEAAARCPECSRFPSYDGSSAFECGCGETVLQK
jgi:DNA repair exonuclease SbcCD ATPase subunit